LIFVVLPELYTYAHELENELPSDFLQQLPWVLGSLTLTGMETLRLSLFEVFANAKRDLAEAKL